MKSVQEILKTREKFWIRTSENLQQHQHQQQQQQQPH